MSVPVLSPISTTSTVVLPSTGSSGDVLTGCPFGMYADPSSGLYSTDFVSGAVDQVNYTYRKLGGDVLDIELTPYNVYSSYEESVLSYSEILNYHQAKNVIGSMLGQRTGSFDSDGNLSGSMAGSHYEVKFPRFRFGYAERVAQGTSEAIGIGGEVPVYSGSIDLTYGVQDYDLQAAMSSSVNYSGSVGDKRIKIHKVFFKTPNSAWRFFGLFGSPMSVYGDGSMYGANSFGMYSDNTTFEVIPVWEHKLQAMKYEDAINVRCSHFTYELRNNKLRLFPVPTLSGLTPTKMWFQFSVEDDIMSNPNPGTESEIDGVNNVNNLPFENLPYSAINSMGKNWIRRFSLALSKETLGQVRGKFNPLPIPNQQITLNAEQLLSQAKEEMAALKEELQKTLEQVTYAEIAKKDAEIADAAQKTLTSLPLLIFIG